MMQNRAGMALVEVLVAAILSSVILTSGAVLLQAQSRLAHNATERSERNDAARAALLTLRAELQTLSPAVDLRGVARDSIAARIFRGIGFVCGFRTDAVYLRYEGLRLPDPAKDSLLQIGVENAAAFSTVSENASLCPHRPNEQVLALTLDAAAPIGSMWLVFESGAYHLSTYALRYRRGAESRQPITNEVINDRASWFGAVRDTAIRGLRVYLRSRAAAGGAQDHLGLLNAR